MSACPFETFTALEALPVLHAFTGRVQGVDVKTDRLAALERLAEYHEQVRTRIGAGSRKFITAEQVHGAVVAHVTSSDVGPMHGADALITDDPSVCLGIYVADCAPVWLVDPVHRAVGCIHSGRKGTELGIVGAAISAMVRNFGSKPREITAQIGPCIRPPNYEVDFAADIVRQCRESGLVNIHDCGRCTAADPSRYYSYRREKGQTGRMLALLGLK